MRWPRRVEAWLDRLAMRVPYWRHVPRWLQEAAHWRRVAICERHHEGWLLASFARGRPYEVSSMDQLVVVGVARCTEHRVKIASRILISRDFQDSLDLGLVVDEKLRRSISRRIDACKGMRWRENRDRVDLAAANGSKVRNPQELDL